MRDIIVFLIVFGTIPFILVRPYVGVLVWTWLGIMNPHRLCFGFAFEFPFAQVIAIVTILAFFYYREKAAPVSSAVLYFWIMFVLWTGATTLFAVYPEAANMAWVEFMKVSLMGFLAVVMTSDKQKLHAYVWVVVLSLGFYGLKGGLFTLVTGGQFHVWGPLLTFIADNNHIALAMVMMLPLLRYLQVHAGSILVKRSLLVLMGLTVLSILGTQSRGGFLGLATMGAFLILKSRHKLTFGIFILVFIPLFLTFMPQTWHDRMDSIKNYEQDESAMERINAWGYAINFARDNPVFGGGFDSFTEEQFKTYAPDPDNFNGAHSIYFEVLGEHGYTGLIIFLLLGVALLKQTNYVRKKAKHYDDMLWASDLAAMIQVSAVGYAITGAFLEVATFDLYYILITMSIVTHTLLVKRMRNPEADLSNERASAEAEVDGVQIVGVGRRPA